MLAEETQPTERFIFEAANKEGRNEEPNLGKYGCSHCHQSNLSRR